MRDEESRFTKITEKMPCLQNGLRKLERNFSAYKNDRNLHYTSNETYICGPSGIKILNMTNE
jgi:hypothetical protein